MKRFRIGLLLLGIVSIVYSQVPDGFNYQAVLRNTDGTIKANEAVALQISLIDDNGSSSYMEIHNTQTNELGLINVVIGEGETSEDISTIDWSAKPFFLDITVNGVNLGSSPLLSVPYAVYSGNAHSALSADKVRWMDIDDIPTILAAHLWQHRSRQQHGTDIVGLQYVPECLFSQVFKCAGTQDPGVVNKHVYRAGLAHHGIDKIGK